jgi:glucan 1,3-beta-glucosidase
MWLNGFNDNLPGFPKVQCSYKECDAPYMGTAQPGTPVDPTKPVQGPFGTGSSGPSFGKCPSGQPWSDDAFMHQIASKKLQAWSVGHGFYFWNFRTEGQERWDYLASVENGWFPDDIFHYGVEITEACTQEDAGNFQCIARSDVFERTLESGLQYACDNCQSACDCTPLANSGMSLEDKCNKIFNEFWQAKRGQGATCDFGGAAVLKYNDAPSSAIVVPEVESNPAVIIVAVSCLSSLVGAALYQSRRRRLNENTRTTIDSGTALRGTLLNSINA